MCLQLFEHRGLPVEPVEDEQALWRQLFKQRHAEHLLALPIQAEGGVQRCVRAEFHQRAHADRGKGGTATPGLRFDDAREMLRCVAHAPARAVDAQEPQPGRKAPGMQVCISQWTQRLTHDEQEEVRPELRPTLTEGGVAESHSEKVAQALGEATGKGQRVGDEADHDLPGENLAPWPLVTLHVAGLELRLIPVQQLENTTGKIERLDWEDADIGGWRVHPMSVNQENKKYSNYGLTALGLKPELRTQDQAFIRLTSHSKLRSGCLLRFPRWNDR